MAVRPSVVLLHPIHPAGEKILKERFTLKIGADKVSPKARRELVKGAEVIISQLIDPIDSDLLEAAGEQLKLVAQYAVGTDNIDLDACKRRGVLVSNTPGALSGPAVAELAFCLMLSTARHIVPADHFMRTGEYHHWDPTIFLGPQLMGKTVGIIGTGQIGSIFAGMCHNGLRMRVLYSDLLRNHMIEKELGASHVSMEKVLAEADVVSLHVPLLPGTHHLIGAAQLKLMKASSILINTSRGPVVDEKALVQALKAKQIFAAGLDVFEFEPKLAAGLAQLKNVVVTPHIGSATESARIAMAECVARTACAVLSGETPANVIK